MGFSTYITYIIQVGPPYLQIVLEILFIFLVCLDCCESGFAQVPQTHMVPDGTPLKMTRAVHQSPLEGKRDQKLYL